ncbi:UDP-4-amino-4,6-dideoxy-N-acetyl-beta-L-altrosamine transaminase [Sediminibacterium sp.]|uniref:UDP-4-amino-4, 6-dideoxy-N-acetyl-beta-L-altrosamine transaminase n=1 Tax=Sediminibacterium sp. TaxID=1917865 RepID=UPI0025ECB822|nr:UDP-4-amino-4,6-dideoxy-N-acetyl-beta-L-altrosamine transaminase [Sediminibacterium sp.]MBW0177651.1 UDP-4-amino-4,6-dideoxy-N-acetyl-beta-L-altrosamine transaminase [Sediminibacterium sp.]
MIPYGRQDISSEDIQAVIDVLKSDYLTQGPAIPAFEQAVASYCGVKFGVAVNSATSALHIACMALDLGKGDILWTSPITFVASANCALYCGASVDFVDIDPKTYNMSVEALELKLQQAEIDGKLPKILIPVHLAGQSCEMEKIYLLSKKYGFRIIEDASHGIGGKYKGAPIGNCKYSDITVFSFHPVKIITTGEGGMCMTNDPEIALRLTHYRSHGITRQPAEMTHVPDGPWYYQQIDLGFNYRITDIHAALGLSQLKRLDDFVSRRHEIAKRYDKSLESDTLTIHYQHPDTYSAYHLYIIRHKKKEGGIGRLQMFEKLRAAGILVNLHYIPVYHHPYYENTGKYKRSDFPNAEAYYSEAISIPMHTVLTEEEQQFVIEQIEKPMGHQNLF